MDLDRYLNKIVSAFRKRMTRREFVGTCAKAALCAGVGANVLGLYSKYQAYAAIGEKRGMREALFYEKISDETVKCLLCPMGCVLSNGQRGFCRVREPVDGKLYTLVYELACALHIDPVEKKPIFHMMPGHKTLSVATAGCNSRCKYCQNWDISQSPPEETKNKIVTAGDLVGSARTNRCASISYTYSEPAVFYEYMTATAALAKQHGVRNIMVTSGKINPEPLENACKLIDAAHVDLKGFDKKYLKDTCAQDLDNILGSLVIMKKNGVWVEVVNLVVPGLNDRMEDIKRMSAWICDNLTADTPLHFSRFWPQYKMRSHYPTPEETLIQARETAIGEGLRYVYIGNIPGSQGENTFCPSCKRTVIERTGYTVRKNNLDNGACGFCGQKIPGIWS
ncbi:MAG TPA: AmmeMemoRadiSam system radical SAM enzyme [Candidatus Omnitrophota bacterium]|nr:AmmeMemoRadiSam system radical SAM enzyme [Candidatus Omnitrophota bacterium]HPS20459.1 AmmeMemoRadiSam system radical SAM enzyme [Candidatus Omnitrophota bacterium]